MRPPLPPPPWVGSPAPPYALIVPEPDKLCAVIQTLPPDPPPERLLVPFAPSAEMLPLMMNAPPAVIFIAPPPAPPMPAYPAPPPLPKFVGWRKEP